MSNEHEVINKSDPNLSFSFHEHGAPPPSQPPKKAKNKWVKKKPAHNESLSFHFGATKSNIEDLSFEESKELFSVDNSHILNIHEASMQEPSLDMEEIMNQINAGGAFKKGKAEEVSQSDLTLKEESSLNILKDFMEEEESVAFDPPPAMEGPQPFDWQ